MRKLPEAWSKLIREFEEKEGAVEALTLGGFAPDDDAFDRHPAVAEPWVDAVQGHGKLGADAELPARDEAHPAFGNLDGTARAILIGATFQKQTWGQACARLFALNHREPQS